MKKYWDLVYFSSMINISFQCFFLLISTLKIRFMNVKAQYSWPIFSRSCFNIEFTSTYNILAQYWVNIASMLGNVEKIGKFSLNYQRCNPSFFIIISICEICFLNVDAQFQRRMQAAGGGGEGSGLKSGNTYGFWRQSAKMGRFWGGQLPCLLPPLDTPVLSIKGRYVLNLVSMLKLCWNKIF